MGETITGILYEKEKMSSNKLRGEIRTDMLGYQEGMRKYRQSTDNNTCYNPSESKISAIINQLLEWNWIKKSVDDKELKPGFRGLSKVYYSLTEDAKFAWDIAIPPHEWYLLKDLYQMMLRTAAMGINTLVWDEELGMDKLSRTTGTTMDDIYFKKDGLLFANYNHRRFTREEIKHVFEEAIERKIIRKEIVNNEIRYVIDPILKDFVKASWDTLYMNTLHLVSFTYMLNRFSKKDPNNKKIYEWLLSTNDKVHVDNVLFIKWSEDRSEFESNNKKRLERVEQIYNKVSKMKNELKGEIERELDKESLEFNKAVRSVLYYVCPDYLLKAINEIVKIKKDKLESKSKA